MTTVTVDGETLEVGDGPVLPSTLMRASGITSPERYDLLALPMSNGDHAVRNEPLQLRDGAQFITARKSTTVS
ncbi:hypothetical protein [Herbiconiux solani]|uniref:hypothetical protein n=1 Tax=Herbiconiux solani TaxID=661329 RepID=UPI000825A6C2|nr:hypothetical protein [Herbiconiux solani]